MNVLFLDFDGPLFPDRMISFHPDNIRPYPGDIPMTEWVSYWKMDELTVYMLNLAQERHQFKTVISSSWKRFTTLEQIKDLFKVNGLILDIHDDYSTPDLGRLRTIYSHYSYMDSRSAEIIAWLKDHPDVGDYIIIDDPSSGASLDEKSVLRPDRIIMIDPDVGLRSEDYKRINSIIAEWNGIPLSKRI